VKRKFAKAGFLFLISPMQKFARQEEMILDDIERVLSHLADRKSFSHCVIRDVDFRNQSLDWILVDVEGATFMGCHFSSSQEMVLREKGAFLFPNASKRPYNPYRNELYHWQELMEGYSAEKDESVDYQIYQHFSQSRFNPGIREAMSQRIHDHAIDHALRELMAYDDKGHTEKKGVGIMGGHGTLRTDPYFRKVTVLAKSLTEAGYYVASGGGPGIMEAANLGAWLAGQEVGAVETALAILAKAPHYTDQGYLDTAQEVINRFPRGSESLAIPTWFYGHEPSNLFATHIAKYFSNSIREDTLLAISLYGVIFAPGSAGTTQEIFMEAAQNHYCTFNYYSPMVFLGEKRYEIDTLIYPLLRQLSYGRAYHDLLLLSDSPSEILEFLQTHPPVAKA